MTGADTAQEIAALRRDNELLQDGIARLAAELKAASAAPSIQQGMKVERKPTSHDLSRLADSARESGRRAWYFELMYLAEKARDPAAEGDGSGREGYERDRDLVLMSGLFDAAYYLEQNPDVARANFAAIDHFLQFGGAEGRRPTRDFDSRGYLDAHRDVAQAGLNPLVHFIRSGALGGAGEGSVPDILPRPRALPGS